MPEIIDLVSSDEEDARPLHQMPLQEPMLKRRKVEIKTEFQPKGFGQADSEDCIEIRNYEKDTSIEVIPPPNTLTSKAEANTNDDEEIQFIGGAETALDFAHSRDACSQFAFTVPVITEMTSIVPQGPVSNLKFCKTCFCYICQVPAHQCFEWTLHAHATYKAQAWKVLQHKRAHLPSSASVLQQMVNRDPIRFLFSIPEAKAMLDHAFALHSGEIAFPGGSMILHKAADLENPAVTFSDNGPMHILLQKFSTESSRAFKVLMSSSRDSPPPYASQAALLSFGIVAGIMLPIAQFYSTTYLFKPKFQNIVNRINTLVQFRGLYRNLVFFLLHPSVSDAFKRSITMDMEGIRRACASKGQSVYLDATVFISSFHLLLSADNKHILTPTSSSMLDCSDLHRCPESGRLSPAGSIIIEALVALQPDGMLGYIASLMKYIAQPKPPKVWAKTLKGTTHCANLLYSIEIVVAAINFYRALGHGDEIVSNRFICDAIECLAHGAAAGISESLSESRNGSVLKTLMSAPAATRLQILVALTKNIAQNDAAQGLDHGLLIAEILWKLLDAAFSRVVTASSSTLPGDGKTIKTTRLASLRSTLDSMRELVECSMRSASGFSTVLSPLPLSDACTLPAALSLAQPDKYTQSTNRSTHPLSHSLPTLLLPAADYIEIVTDATKECATIALLLAQVPILAQAEVYVLSGKRGRMIDALLQHRNDPLEPLKFALLAHALEMIRNARYASSTIELGATSTFSNSDNDRMRTLACSFMSLSLGFPASQEIGSNLEHLSSAELLHIFPERTLYSFAELCAGPNTNGLWRVPMKYICPFVEHIYDQNNCDRYGSVSPWSFLYCAVLNHAGRIKRVGVDHKAALPFCGAVSSAAIEAVPPSPSDPYAVLENFCQISLPQLLFTLRIIAPAAWEEFEHMQVGRLSAIGVDYAEIMFPFLTLCSMVRRFSTSNSANANSGQLIIDGIRSIKKCAQWPDWLPMLESLLSYQRAVHFDIVAVLLFSQPSTPTVDTPVNSARVAKKLRPDLRHHHDAQSLSQPADGAEISMLNDTQSFETPQHHFHSTTDRTGDNCTPVAPITVPIDASELAKIIRFILSAGSRPRNFMWTLNQWHREINSAAKHMEIDLDSILGGNPIHVNQVADVIVLELDLWMAAEHERVKEPGQHSLRIHSQLEAKIGWFLHDLSYLHQSELQIANPHVLLIKVAEQLATSSAYAPFCSPGLAALRQSESARQIASNLFLMAFSDKRGYDSSAIQQQLIDALVAILFEATIDSFSLTCLETSQFLWAVVGMGTTRKPTRIVCSKVLLGMLGRFSREIWSDSGTGMEKSGTPSGGTVAALCLKWSLRVFLAIPGGISSTLRSQCIAAIQASGTGVSESRDLTMSRSENALGMYASQHGLSIHGKRQVDAITYLLFPSLETWGPLGPVLRNDGNKWILLAACHALSPEGLSPILETAPETIELLLRARLGQAWLDGMEHVELDAVTSEGWQGVADLATHASHALKKILKDTDKFDTDAMYLASDKSAMVQPTWEIVRVIFVLVHVCSIGGGANVPCLQPVACVGHYDRSSLLLARDALLNEISACPRLFTIIQALLHPIAASEGIQWTAPTPFSTLHTDLNEHFRQGSQELVFVLTWLQSMLDTSPVYPVYDAKLFLAHLLCSVQEWRQRRPSTLPGSRFLLYATERLLRQEPDSKRANSKELNQSTALSRILHTAPLLLLPPPMQFLAILPEARRLLDMKAWESLSPNYTALASSSDSAAVLSFFSGFSTELAMRCGVIHSLFHHAVDWMSSSSVSNDTAISMQTSFFNTILHALDRSGFLLDPAPVEALPEEVVCLIVTILLTPAITGQSSNIKLALDACLQRQFSSPKIAPGYSSIPTEDFTAFFAACRTGQVHDLSALLHRHPRIVNVQDKRGCTALKYASGDGYIDCVEVLLGSFGINVGICDSGGSSALSAACYGGHTEVVDLLLGVQGINVNVADVHGRTALIEACDKSHVGCIKALLTHPDTRKSVNASTSSNDTALHYAAARGCVQAVIMLLQVPGIDPGRKSVKKLTACASASCEAIKIIITAELGRIAEANELGLKLLKAAELSDVFAIKEALQLDSFQSESWIRTRIVNHGDSINGSTPLHKIIASPYASSKALQTLLSDPLVDPNIADFEGLTPLHIIVRRYKKTHMELLQTLLSHPSIDPNKPTDNGKFTPLILAVTNEDVSAGLECINVLLQHPRILVNEVEQAGNAAALNIAVSAGNLNAAKALVAAVGVDLSIATSNGNTALSESELKGGSMHELMLTAHRRHSEEGVVSVPNSAGATVSTHWPLQQRILAHTLFKLTFLDRKPVASGHITWTGFSNSGLAMASELLKSPLLVELVTIGLLKCSRVPTADESTCIGGANTAAMPKTWPACPLAVVREITVHHSEFTGRDSAELVLEMWSILYAATIKMHRSARSMIPLTSTEKFAVNSQTSSFVLLLWDLAALLASNLKTIPRDVSAVVQRYSVVFQHIKRIFSHVDAGFDTTESPGASSQVSEAMSSGNETTNARLCLLPPTWTMLLEDPPPHPMSSAATASSQSGCTSRPSAASAVSCTNRFSPSAAKGQVVLIPVSTSYQIISSFSSQPQSSACYKDDVRPFEDAGIVWVKLKKMLSLSSGQGKNSLKSILKEL